MDKNSVIYRLFELGHFDNPAHLTGVSKEDLPELKLTDGPVKTAIASYQEFMAADFDAISIAEHGRIGVADGEIGPATERLFRVQRCGCPDYGVEAANGSGSWPVGCHEEFPSNHSFAVYIARSGMPGYLKSVFEQCWLLCRQAYADIGIAFFEVDSQSRANTVVTWQRGAGWIGLAIVPRSPRCGERIWAKFDNRYQPRDMVNQWARLLAHEFCHNMGLSHTRGGIMNPSITSGAFTPTAWRGDPSERALVRFFGGDPVNIGGDPDVPDDPDDPPPPDIPPPGPNEFWFKGDFQLMRGDESLGNFILTPKPEV